MLNKMVRRPLCASVPDLELKVSNVAKKSQNGRAGAASAKINSKLVEHVSMKVEAFIGDAELTIAELSAFKPGEVVALDASLNQSVELRVNGIVVAQGELVAVEDKFGVRITAVES